MLWIAWCRLAKVRYLGTSNENAHGLTKSNTIADYEGMARFQSIQNNFSLLNRPLSGRAGERLPPRECLTAALLAYWWRCVLSGKYNDGQIPENARFSSYLSAEDPRQRAMAERFVNAGTLSLHCPLCGHSERGRDVSGDPGHRLEHAI